MPPESGKLNLKKVETIYVADNIKLKPGVKITDGYVVGKLLSHGVQGEVSTLVDEQGQDTEWLVKVMFLKNAFDDMEREWKIGRTLNLLNNPTFMFTGPALRGQKTGGFAGMFIHKIHGCTCDTIVMDKKFTDLRWLRKCLFTTLMALDEAQKLLGFHHYDFRLGNLMVTGKCEADWRDADKAQFKIIDFGLGAFDDAFAMIPNDSDAVTALVTQLCQRQLTPDNSDDSNNTSQLSSITNTLSGLLSAIPSGPSKLLGTLRDMTGDSDKDSNSSSRARMSGKGLFKPMRGSQPDADLSIPEHLPATQEAPIFTPDTVHGTTITDRSSGVALQETMTSVSTDPAASAEALMDTRSGRGLPGPPGPDATLSASGKSNGSTAAVPDPGEPIGEVTNQSWSVKPFARGDPVPQWLTTGIFKGYRQFWQHKGDILYMCFSLVANLDYHVWPKEDEHDVRRLMNFIHHVTGIRLKVAFSDDVHSMKKASRRKWFHVFRTIHVRGRILFRPFNSGITAAEALCAPFFAVCPDNPYNGLSGRSRLMESSTMKQ